MSERLTPDESSVVKRASRKMTTLGIPDLICEAFDEKLRKRIPTFSKRQEFIGGVIVNKIPLRCGQPEQVVGVTWVINWDKSGEKGWGKTINIHMLTEGRLIVDGNCYPEDLYDGLVTNINWARERDRVLRAVKNALSSPWF